MNSARGLIYASFSACSELHLCKNASKRRVFIYPPPIAAVPEKDIGRPATYALIVDALLTRKYVMREPDGQLRLTQRGQEVCEFLIERFPALFALAYTAQMESALDEVAQGEISYEKAVMDISKNLKI